MRGRLRVCIRWPVKDFFFYTKRVPFYFIYGPVDDDVNDHHGDHHCDNGRAGDGHADIYDYVDEYENRF